MRLKKLISGVLAGLTAISSIPFSSSGVIASAADEEKNIWDGTTDTSWYNSEETEFHISTPEELAGLAELVNGGKNMSGQTFVLDNDIYLNDVSDFQNWTPYSHTNQWIPIGTRGSYCFSGIFDGSGFSIKGLYISGDDYQYSGLFGYTAESSEISNVNMTYEYIYIVYLVKHYSGGITAYSNGKINNCSTSTRSIIKNSYDSESDSCSAYIGGIAGYSTAEISECSNNATVTSTTKSYSYVGGITSYSTAEINKCTNSGIIDSYSNYKNSSYGGGISSYSTANISNCTNSGAITSSSSSYSYGGGIAGYSTANISNCTNNEIIKSTSSSISNICVNSYGGGISGYSNASMNDCINNGNIISTSDSYSSSSYGGGISGYSINKIKCCVNNGDLICSSKSSSRFYSSSRPFSYSYEGGISGFSSDNINSCVNNGNLISNCSHNYDSNCYVGGIIGNIYCSSDAKEIIISNNYNTGDINADCSECIGGIVGNSSYNITINNTYNIGKVSSAILGKLESNNELTITNSSYLVEQSKQGCKDYTDDEKTIAKSRAKMQTKEFAESLGDAFKYVVGHYPVLSFQKDSEAIEGTKEEGYNIDWYDASLDEYHLSTAEELIGLHKVVSSRKSLSEKTVYLDNDIVLNDISDYENWETTAPANVWESIGYLSSDNKSFSGTFDGQGHSIIGLYSTTGGLFAYLSNATVKNVILSNEYVKTSSTCGGLANSSSSSTLDGIGVNGSISGETAGGLVGDFDGTMSNCYNKASVNGSDYSGGLTGNLNGTINTSYNIGKVTGSCEGGISGKGSSVTLNKAYYANANTKGIGSATSDSAIAKSDANMKKESFAISLGDAFVYVKGNYPRLAWEVNGNIEEPTEVISETTSEDTSNIENTTDISERESISTDITESPSESETTTTTTTSSDVTTTLTTTTLPVTTMVTSTMTTENTTSTEVTKLSTTITTTTTEPLKAEIDSIEIEVGEKTIIKANQDNLIFKTSNSDVAIVSKTGIITPISAGTAIISVINSDGDSVQIKIEIKDPSLETTTIKTTEKITVATTTTTNKLTTEKTTSVTTTIVNPTTIVTTKPTIKISVGDVNDDGIIDSKDAVFVLKSYAETLAGNVATVSIEKGDVNGDGKIDSKDAVKILKYYASTMVGYKGNIVNFN